MINRHAEASGRGGFLIAAGLAILIGALGYAYVSPWLTVAKMRKAAQSGDVDTINAHVDFPALRESFKAWINAHMVRQLAKDENGRNPFSLVGFALAAKLGDIFVDALVTPETVRLMLEGQRPQPNPAQAPRRRSSPSRADPEATPREENDAEMLARYESWDTFVTTFRKRQEPSDSFTLVWRRTALMWKLSAVRLPIPKD